MDDIMLMETPLLDSVMMCCCGSIEMKQADNDYWKNFEVQPQGSQYLVRCLQCERSGIVDPQGETGSITEG